jgi:tetratricopeptide (TPR) repeat protein
MGGLLYFGMSQKQADHEFDIKKAYHNAVLSEKGGKYTESAELYENVLKLDPKNPQARFNLARIYDKKLNDSRSARRHYKALTEHTPKGHPFHMEALEALQQLSPPPAGKA